MEKTLVYRVAAALFPEHPLKCLAGFAGVAEFDREDLGLRQQALGLRQPSAAD